MSKGDTVETAGEVLQTEREQLKKDVEQMKEDVEQLKKDLEQLKKDVEQLKVEKQELQDKEQLMCRALKSARGCVSHEKLRKLATQAEESHWKELLEPLEGAAGDGGELQEAAPDHLWRRKFSEMEEKFRKELVEEQEKLHNELLQQEELMKQKLSDEDEAFQKLLDEVCHHWESSAGSWVDKQKELGEMIQNNNNTWKQMEAQYKEEIQHLREEILQLQGLLQQKCLETNSKM